MTSMRPMGSEYIMNKWQVAAMPTTEFIHRFVQVTPHKPQMETTTMPKAIKLPKNKEFTFKAAAGQASKYDWNGWFNGDLLMLERSEMTPTGLNDAKGKPTFKVVVAKDFDVEVDAMPPKIKTAARRRYKVVQISRVDADGNKLKDAIIIKARDMTADEKASEDIKRAEEKAARAEAGEEETEEAAAE